MASFIYNQAGHEINDNTLDIVSNTTKLMLVTTSYTANKDHTVIDNGANDATDPSFNELTVSGYTGGFAGAGRKTIDITGQVNNTDDRSDWEIHSATITWTTLTAGETIGGAIIVKEITNDTASRLIAYLDLTDTATNGGDFSITRTDKESGGNIRFTY